MRTPNQGTPIFGNSHNMSAQPSEGQGSEFKAPSQRTCCSCAQARGSQIKLQLTLNPKP